MVACYLFWTLTYVCYSYFIPIKSNLNHVSRKWHLQNVAFREIRFTCWLWHAPSTEFNLVLIQGDHANADRRDRPLVSLGEADAKAPGLCVRQQQQSGIDNFVLHHIVLAKCHSRERRKHIWQIGQSLAIFDVYLCIWLLGLLLGWFIMQLGKFSLLQMAKYWKINLAIWYLSTGFFVTSIGDPNYSIHFWPTPNRALIFSWLAVAVLNF